MHVQPDLLQYTGPAQRNAKIHQPRATLTAGTHDFIGGLIHWDEVNRKNRGISTLDGGGLVLIFTPPIMGQQLRARAKRKRRTRQIQRKIDTAKAVVKKNAVKAKTKK
jgi:hypothetical protein